MASQPTEKHHYPFSFTGDGSEYFRIWIVNVALSIVTLYIYSAWAKVRNLRYFHGNTVLDGASFEYHATPLQILFGRVFAVILLIVVTIINMFAPVIGVTLAVIGFLLLPWVAWRSTKFNARMSSYRNVRFGFVGSLRGMYWYVVILPLLPLIIGGGLVAGLMQLGEEVAPFAVLVGSLAVFVFFLLTPWYHCKLATYFIDNYRYGKAAFVSSFTTRRFYGIYIRLLLLSVALFFGITAIVAGLLAVSGQISMDSLDAIFNSESAEAEEQFSAFMLGMFGLIVLGYALLILATYVTRAWFQARIHNHLYGNTVIDGKVALAGTFRARSLFWLMISNLGLLIISGGFAIAWTRVRTARYKANHTAAFAEDELHGVVGVQQEHQSSLGEELGDAFDADLDIGF